MDPTIPGLACADQVVDDGFFVLRDHNLFKDFFGRKSLWIAVFVALLWIAGFESFELVV